ncbi:MAG: FeoA family protein [Terrimicrobiaceae bacterium]|jgi:Fe2+ transport system protein FeoA
MSDTLESLPVGGEAEISEIRTDCDRAGRMSSLGFIPGRRVRITRVAPLGDPISVRIDGQEISLRRAEARIIGIRNPKP